MRGGADVLFKGPNSDLIYFYRRSFTLEYGKIMTIYLIVEGRVGRGRCSPTLTNPTSR
jgi:hypothetical protein